MKAEISIRRTLLIRCGLGLCVILVLLSLSIYFMVRRGLYEELDQSIIETASILANQMEYENGGIIFEWQEGLGTNADISDQSLFQYWNEKSGLTTRSPALGTTDLPKFSGADGAPVIETFSVPGQLEHARGIGLMIHPYVIPSEQTIMDREGKTFDPLAFPHTLVVARDVTPVLRTLTFLAAALGIGTLAALVLAFLVIVSAVRASLAPIAKLTRQVRDRSENQLDSALVVPGALPSELVPLAESFDRLLSRVAAIRSRERDFIRHAAHELRTPIASLSAITELALSKDRDAGQYVRHLGDCARISANLAALVQRLSELSRIGSESAAVRSMPIDLADILATSSWTFSRKAEIAGLTIEPPSGAGEAMGDSVLAALILKNLLDNAISYSPKGTAITSQIESQGDRCLVSVTNLSDELPEDLERLFEPLFRRDTSRTESAGSHLGIGLTLSREAAHAMGGTLTASRTDGGGVTFTLSLPVKAE